MLDLAAVGRGNPSALTAAVLDQATYPRLVKAMEEHAEQPARADETAPRAMIEPASISPPNAPAAANESEQPALPESTAPKAIAVMKPEAAPETNLAARIEVVALEPQASSVVPAVAAVAPAASEVAIPAGAARIRHNGNGAHAAEARENGKHEEPAFDAEDTGPMSRVMMRRWKSAYREGDLPACREVFSVFEPIADADLVRSMREQLDEVVQRTERRLRLQFQQLVHEQRFEEALRVGDEMEKVLPERPIAQEFARIKPHLLRRAHSA
jgi:hypothetical protein